MSVDSVLVSFAKLKHKFYDECLYDNKDIFPDYAKKSPYIFGLKSGLIKKIK